MVAPQFTKHGELTFLKSNGTPIVTFDVEIADTEEKRERGSMGRPTPGEREGMLFIPTCFLSEGLDNTRFFVYSLQEIETKKGEFALLFYRRERFFSFFTFQFCSEVKDNAAVKG